MDSSGSSVVRAIEWLFQPQRILLVIVALVVSHGITSGELHFYTDEQRHAFTGVFLRDFLVDRPLAHPLQYASEYYAKYPALGIPHWPPLFHFIEALFFLVFGISVWVSRLAVLCFALLGVYFWYRIAALQGPRYRAFFAALIFACMPYVLLYERATMLEIPAVALCLGAVYYWLRLLETGRSAFLWATAAFAAAAFLTSQTAIFLGFFFGLSFLVEHRFALLRRWQMWLALASVGAVVVPWYALAFHTLVLGTARAYRGAFSYLGTKIHLLFYLTQLPRQLGLVLLCLGVAGAAWALFTAPRRWRFLLLWLASCYLCFTLIYEKDPRHTFIWIPPFVYLALLALEVLLVRKRLGVVAGAGLSAIFLINGFRFQRPKVSGVEGVARYVLSLPESDIVYYQGDLNGDFVFFVRKFDPEKRHMVAREKQIVASQFGRDPEHVLGSYKEILKFFRVWGIRYAVIESFGSMPELHFVQELFRSDQFELVRRFPLQAHDPAYAGREILVYRYRGELERASQPVVIPMMTIRNDIRVDLTHLVGRPWPN